jgi:hypothetical protein
MDEKDYVGEDLALAPPELCARLIRAFGEALGAQRQTRKEELFLRLSDLLRWSDLRYLREKGLVFHRADALFARASRVASLLLDLPEAPMEGVEFRPTTEQRMAWFVHAWGRFAMFAGAEKRVSSEELLRAWEEAEVGS